MAEKLIQAINVVDTQIHQIESQIEIYKNYHEGINHFK